MSGTTYNVDSAPFTCAAGVLSTTTGGNIITVTTGAPPTPYGAGPASGGFGDIGFLPAGTLYFYYGVAAETVANAAAPTTANLAAGASLTATKASPGTAIVGVALGTNKNCGGGYIAVAQSNFAGSNLQAYVTKIKVSDLFILLLPTAFDDAVGSFCLTN